MATSHFAHSESSRSRRLSGSLFTLPSYTSRATSVERSIIHGGEHQYTLGSSTGKPWLALTIRSRSPDSSLLPLYYEGDTVTGAVSVDLKSGEHIREVSVTLQGQILGAGQDLEPYTFLNMTQVVWSQKSGRLNGSHSWDFAIAPPREVTVPSITAPSLPVTYQLPPKFSERGSQAHIDYKILVTVRRRRFSVDSTLFTPFVYLPYSIASSPSMRRQVAYRNRTIPPGPEADPEGWKVLPTFEVTGALASSRPASISCTFAIAEPLSFAANTCVPVHVTLQSRFDDLLTHASIQVQLVRTLYVHDFTPTRRGTSFYDVMSEAVFWPASDSRMVPGTKVLCGELPLRKKLTSSFTFSKVSIQYAVVLSAIRAPNFSLPPLDKPLLSEPVQVTLKNPHGVSPRSYAPADSPLTAGTSSYNRHAQQRFERATYVGYPYVGLAA